MSPETIDIKTADNYQSIIFTIGEDYMFYVLSSNYLLHARTQKTR